MSINSITLVGFVGRDPELKVYDSGSQKCTTTLAVTRLYSKDKVTDWFPIQFWGKLAEIAQNYLKKGKQIAVSGSCHIDKYTDASGNTKLYTYVKENNLEFINSKPKESSSPRPNDEPPFDQLDLPL